MKNTPAGSSILKVLATWAALAMLAGWLGVVELVPFPPAIIMGLVVTTLVTLRLRRGWWVLATTLDPRLYLIPHLSRFVGFYFLALYEQGRLPYDFAVLGGWGDIVVASGVALLLILRIKNRVTLFVWNLVGLADILFVAYTATRLMLTDPESMSELMHLPLALLPLFVVPMIVISHLLLNIRLLTCPDKAQAREVQPGLLE